jgi:hypothetical protein
MVESRHMNIRNFRGRVRNFRARGKFFEQMNIHGNNKENIHSNNENKKDKKV